MNAPAEIKLHAKLSASGSGKWLTCTPSARLEEQFSDEQSEFAAEGTFAHEVFEYVLNGHLKGYDVSKYEGLSGHQYFSRDLLDHVHASVAVVLERIEEARQRSKDPVIMVEQRLDFSVWVPEGFGTGDVVIVSDGVVEVLDLKYGKGISVYAPGNTQMRLYALGALHELAHLYDIETVRMTILQPRLDNYSTDEITAAELLGWAENFVKPRAELAWDGKGEFVAGDHCHQYFCRARATCRARAEGNLALARVEFAMKQPDLLFDDEIAQVLAKAESLAKWAGEVQEYALKKAEAGRKFAGWKLVEGRSNRKYSNPDAVAAKLLQSGIDEAVIYERSLLGITAMEKAIGKKVFTEVLGGLVVKPPGKPTLVPETDKRSEIDPAANANASAVADFS